MGRHDAGAGARCGPGPAPRREGARPVSVLARRPAGERGPVCRVVEDVTAVQVRRRVGRHARPRRRGPPARGTDLAARREAEVARARQRVLAGPVGVHADGPGPVRRPDDPVP